MDKPFTSAHRVFLKSSHHALIISVGGGLNDMPLDQAIYHPGRNSIFAVRGGYVGEFNATTGAVIQFKRFAPFCFGDASICYDDVHDKLICSMWNEQRADDALSQEPVDQRGLYKVNPATLAVELFVAIHASPDLYGTTFGMGPHDMVFYNGFVYVSCPKDLKVNPVTFAVINTGSEFSIVGWHNLEVDAVNGRLWKTEASSQVIHYQSLANLTYGSAFTCNTLLPTPVTVDYGTITIPIGTDLLAGVPVMWTGGPFPAGYYSVNYISGSVLRPATPAPPTMLSDWVAGHGIYFPWWLQPTVVGPLGFTATPAGSSPPVVDFLGYDVSPFAYPSMFNTIAEVEIAYTGKSVFVFIPAAVPSFGIQPNFTGTCSVENDLVFQLVRNWDYPLVNNQFNPYGICYCPSQNRLYMTNRGPSLIPFDVGTSLFMASVSMGDGNALPYRVRYNPNDGLVYVPTLRSNNVVIVDPDSNAVVAIKSGFDSPLDVVFTPTRKFAVQQGSAGLKEIV
jgi:hypothetical protein